MPYFLGLILLGATYFLFGGAGLTDTLSRSQKQLWDLAHIGYFFVLLYLFSYLPVLKNLSAKTLILGIVLATLLLGGLIELAQYAFDRTPASEDVVRNLIGALLAMVFLQGYCEKINQRVLMPLRLALLTLLLVQTIPFATSLADEMIAYRQFPVLANNDTPFEITRWEGNADIEIAQTESANLLKIRLLPDRQFPGTSLRYFPGDWSEYDRLVIELYNPSSVPLELIVRVHDKPHEAKYHYQDRFNLTTLVQPGRNELNLGLEKIRNAPQTREMKINEIRDLSFFSNKLSEERTVYIDKIYLSKGTDTVEIE